MSTRITCIIVDDEPAALAQLVRYVEKTPFLELVGAFNSPLEVLAHLQTHAAPQLILLDIQMPELNGLDLAKALPPEVAIIFTTAFEQYAISGYKVNALDYLLKPIDYAEFLAAVGKAKGRQEKAAAPAAEGTDYLFLKSEYLQLKVNLPEIIYIEGLKDYAKVYLTTAPRPVLSLISLKKLEETLPVDRFMRIHRSFIIALDKIDQIERSQVIIQDRRITVGEQYREAFQAFLERRSP
ncbi:MAG: response regulator transcription factor [Bacteroidetes bacterium]|nr:response regulator transcription factor [Bacteroidota bacterium]